MSFSNHIISRTYNGAIKRANAAAPAILSVRRYMLYGASLASAGWLFRHHVYDWSRSSGPSMYPTMPAEEIYTFHRRLSNKDLARSTTTTTTTTGTTTINADASLSSTKINRKLKVGDVIQFTSPVFEGMLAGKRVIGMPGDYVVRDAHQAASVGGAHVPGITDFRTESEIQRGIELREREEPEMIQVPEGHVWVAGDNMSWSRDSRFYGPVPMALIHGVTTAGCEGIFTWKTYGGAMRKLSEEEKEWALNGRSATVVSEE